MAVALRLIYNQINYYIEECKDPRIDHYFLMGSPLKVLTILGLYLYFVKNLGPKIMENRKPFQLNSIMMVYNVLQVVLNFWLAVMGSILLYRRRKEIGCLLVDYGESGLFEAQLTYFYYMLKLTDLLDTVFFVLRKKYNQITFLHVYHHTFMYLGSYIFARYLPGGHCGVLGIINCYVHVIMYFYYFLTSFKPELKQSIWWKKHITQTQILQFAILMVHFLRPLIMGDCQYSKFWLIFGLTQNTFMLSLFIDFYIRAYIKKPNKVQ